MLSVAELTPLTIFFCVFVMLLAGIVHGAMGLGFPLVATPILSVFLDVRLAILLTLLPVVVVNVTSVITSGVSIREIRPFVVLALAAIVGTVLGARMLIVFDPEPFRLFLAFLILLWLSASRIFGGGIEWISTHPRLSMLGFGFLAGIAAGSTNVMVAVLIIYVIEMNLPRKRTVAVLNMCFLSGKLTQIATFGAAGLVTMPIVYVNAGLAVVALGSLLVGVRLARNMELDLYQTLLRVLLALLALILIVQYLV